MQLEPRKKKLLNTLVDQYIKGGQPVGSKVLCDALDINISSATARNIMADLEKLGLLTSPHTSAGRIPTPKGYQFFVDTLLTANKKEETNISSSDVEKIKGESQKTQKIISKTARMLSSLTQFAGIVQAPQELVIYSHVEFLKLAPKRILLITSTSDGDIQNRLLETHIDYTPEQLINAAAYINDRLGNLYFPLIQASLKNELQHIRSDLIKLIKETIKVSDEDELDTAGNDMVISGEKNLLNVDDYIGNMDSLRRLFTLFEEKTQLVQLFDVASKASGVQIFIGGASEYVPNIDMSVVTAPYSKNGKIVGTLGVIGPTRMEYNRVISAVDVASRMLSKALSHEETNNND